MSILSRGDPRRILMHPMFRSFYLPGALYFSAQGILVPILPLYAGAFEVSYGLIGMALAAQSVGLLLGDVPAGMLIRRLGLRRVLLLGAGGAGLATGSLFWAPSIAVVIALQLLSGFFQALFTVAQIPAWVRQSPRIGAGARSPFTAGRTGPAA